MLIDRRLKKFKNIHKGKRAFAIASGPSLNKIDLSLLEGEITLGVNRVYIKEDLNLNYLFVGDRQTAIQYKKELANVEVDALFSSRGIYTDVFRNPNHYYFTGHGAWEFHPNVMEKIHGGRSVSFVVMQFAYYMGIDELYFLGLDHSWDISKSLSKGRQLTTVGEDVNHFDPNYYGDGIKWFEPKYEEMEKSFKMASKFYRKNKRVLANATPDTALSGRIIRKVKYEELFK